MATLFVASGGSNTAPYDTWAKAATSLQTALTASTAGDVVVIQYNAVPAADIDAGNKTYLIPSGVNLISASNDGGSAYTLTAMGTANFVGCNDGVTGIIQVSLASTTGKWAYIWGVTFRTGATSGQGSLNLTGNNPGGIVYRNCYFWLATTLTLNINLCAVSTNSAEFIECTFRFGATGQGLSCSGEALCVGCTLSSSGSTPSTLMAPAASATYKITFIGCDLSLVTGTLCGANLNPASNLIFDRCLLGAGVSPLASITTHRGPQVWILDSHSGDTHMEFGYYTGLGSITKDSSIYFTTGAAAAAWKIVTSSQVTKQFPFRTPFVDTYNTGSSAITPYFEVLRDGSSTAFKDNEIWAEFTVKVTSSSTKASWQGDRADTATVAAQGSGSDQAAGAGTGSWTGESGTAWSGKIDSGSSFTPAEIGYIRGRMNFGVASATIYMDPEIRT